MKKKLESVQKVVDSDTTEKSPKQALLTISSKISKDFKPKNQRQTQFTKLIEEKEITVCYGPAGTGKSFLSTLVALKLISQSDSKYRKIIIIAPAVEADEKLGFLPGDIHEKLAPYIKSTLELMYKVAGKRRIDKLVECEMIEIQSLAFLRGANIDHSIVILEESQNTTKRQMKTFLTRIGENSKFIISGDIEQSDRFRDGKDSGLYYIINQLHPLKEIGFFEFLKEDIVRNPIIGKILGLWVD